MLVYQRVSLSGNALFWKSFLKTSTRRIPQTIVTTIVCRVSTTALFRCVFMDMAVGQRRTRTQCVVFVNVHLHGSQGNRAILWHYLSIGITLYHIYVVFMQYPLFSDLSWYVLIVETKDRSPPELASSDPTSGKAKRHDTVGQRNPASPKGWLVVWLPWIWHFPINIGNVIIPIDVHIFQRGGWTTNQQRMVETL